MHNKKILSAIAALTVSVTLIGGTLAWFTSQDKVTNTFATATTENPDDPNAGIEIEETFDPKEADDLLPGTTVTKSVRVRSEANYDQYLRAKITKVWKDSNGNVITHYAIVKETVNGVEKEVIKYYDSASKVPSTAIKSGSLSLGKIQLNLGTQGTTAGDSWTSKQADGYYYYNQLLPSLETDDDFITSELLASVKFVEGADDNYYKNLKFDVIVEAEATQATQGAVSGWANIPGYVKSLGKAE